EVARPRQVAEVGVVDPAVLALEPDAIDVERAELIDQVGIVGAGQDGRDLAGGELLFQAIRSDVHVEPPSGEVLPHRRADSSTSAEGARGAVVGPGGAARRAEAE